MRPHAHAGNRDELAPVSQKDWGWYDFLSYWMTDVHSIGGYVMAGSLFALGLPAGQVFLALVAGSLLVCVFATLVAVPSQKQGVPFALVIRNAFGPAAGRVPAALRALIAMSWYGIQTWLASNAVCILLARLVPSLSPFTRENIYGFLGLSVLGWVCFLSLWAIQLMIFRRGVETIRRFFDLAGPAIYGVMMVLLAYLFWCNHWRWPGLGFGAGAGHEGSHPLLWANATALVVSYFSGPMLNFGDYARKGRSVGQVALGNFLGLPLNFLFFAALCVATTALTVPLFGSALNDPVEIISRIGNTEIVAIAILTFLVAAAGINIAANLVSGVLDLCVLAPGKIGWRGAGWIFSLGSIAIMPWRLYNNPAHMHMTLDLLAAVIGPIFGILVAESYAVRRDCVGQRKSGVPALLAMCLAALAALAPGFVPGCEALGNFSWFVGALCGFALYVVFAYPRRMHPAPQTLALTPVEE
ncbi:cytosine permease [Swaminathania salitolerans]|uniref:Nitrate reductase n=1 Tax=Swaminathania salitolerans TaxID=182838 RepID=A0A511BTN7_9PROT|nr:cytosine permease [Swaminathania salitolerans]GBQ14069.1 APC transporter NCS1 [Swaminathania salitolerans LMG 21291]GEL02904.1 nitrate reductase [Swaminathania salitolerans]